MTSGPIPLDTLLAHRDWVRAVARAVVRDPNAADDVEQETWLAALSTPPRETSSLRGWFGAVARSRARRIGRSESRRDARETAASRDEATSSAAELAEAADTHRRVVQAVVELDEPYRQTILLRYFEGLSVEDVAARTSAPLETTRSRIKRGVAKLRERLSRELGTDERPWHLALVPLIGVPKQVAGGASAAAGGGAAMAFSTKFAAVAAGVLVVAGVGVVVVPQWTGREETAVAAAPDEAGAPKKRDAGARPAPAPRPRATEADEKPPAPPKKDAEKPRAPDLTVPEKLARAKFGVDWRNTPLRDAFAEIAAKSGVEIVVSAEADPMLGSRGNDEKIESLHLDVEVAAGQVLGLLTQLKGLAYVVEEPRVVIVPTGVKRDASKPTIALQPWSPPAPITVTGRVVDAAGVVVVGAEIVPDLSNTVLAKTDVGGRFEVQLKKPYGALTARAPWQLPSPAVAVEGQPGAQVTLDLATRGPAGAVAVRVTSVDGAPLPNAYVHVGPMQDATIALPDGKSGLQRALLRLTDEKGGATFAAVAPGAPAVVVDLQGYGRFEGVVEVTAGKTSPTIDVKLAKLASLAARLAAMRISFNFTGANPAEVVRFINSAKQTSIVIDPAFARQLEGKAVTLSVSDRPLDEALRALCDAIGGKVVIDPRSTEVVFITAKR